MSLLEQTTKVQFYWKLGFGKRDHVITQTKNPSQYKTKKDF